MSLEAPYYPGGKGMCDGWPADHDYDLTSAGKQIRTHLRFNDDGYRERCQCVECVQAAQAG